MSKRNLRMRAPPPIAQASTALAMSSRAANASAATPRNATQRYQHRCRSGTHSVTKCCLKSKTGRGRKNHRLATAAQFHAFKAKQRGWHMAAVHCMADETRPTEKSQDTVASQPTRGSVQCRAKERTIHTTLEKVTLSLEHLNRLWKPGLDVALLHTIIKLWGALRRQLLCSDVCSYGK
eukprot:3084583-Amphidinium_carterae.2